MKVVFLYAGGRSARWPAARDGLAPGDFFYGAVEMAARGHQMEVLDVASGQGLVSRFDGLLAPLCPPKMRAGDVAALWRLRAILNASDAVVATTSGLAFAAALLRVAGGFSKPVFGIHCGIVNFVHSGWTAAVAGFLLKHMVSVLFADSEKTGFAGQFGCDQAESLWFGVDHTYWTPPSSGERVGVLAVGNDARRDFETLVAAARLAADVPFQIVTRRPPPKDLPSNVTWSRGDWKGEGISDQELRELYRKAACVVVPLTESPQPAGQSVAMQAALCGAPVVITRTSGWWGADVVRPGEDLLTVPEKDAEALAHAIRRCMGRSFPLGRRLIDGGWTMEGFSNRLEQRIMEELR